ncbi:hypothetical protein NM208_g8355 [Fusarium decemcellulare]|uniref:Uncharacterized protein n=1 Tax=Fusarium decemcellulare TaxID=57161 RepID=A0ACC1S5W9_9HYPO|nr:hypothetical protein NM208_g8355 [Fusarium decemcellulare]
MERQHMPARGEVLDGLSELERSDLPDIRDIATPSLHEAEFETQISPAIHSDICFTVGDALHERRLMLYRRSLRLSFVEGLALDRKADPLYVELTFRNEGLATLAQARLIETHFWENISIGNGKMRDALQLLPSLQANPVYLGADFACPGGWFFFRVLLKDYGPLALFVAFYGVQNPVVCLPCSKTFHKTVTTDGDHVLVPFCGCFSLPGIMAGRCANCIRTGSQCEWERLPGYRPNSEREGTRDLALAGREWPTAVRKETSFTARVLNPETCPFARISSKMPGRRIDKAAFLAAVRRHRSEVLISTELIPAHEERSFDMRISKNNFIFTPRHNPHGLLDVTEKTYPREGFAYGNFRSTVLDLTGKELGPPSTNGKEYRFRGREGFDQMFDLLKGWIKKEELDIAGDDNAIPSSNVVFAVNEEPRDENEVSPRSLHSVVKLGVRRDSAHLSNNETDNHERPRRRLRTSDLAADIPFSLEQLSFETSKTPLGTVTGHTGCFSAFYSRQSCSSVGPPLLVQSRLLPSFPQGYLLSLFTERMDRTCGQLGHLSYRCDILRAEEDIKAYAYFFRGPRGWQTFLASLQRLINTGSLTMVADDDSPLPLLRFSMEEVDIGGDIMLRCRKKRDIAMLSSD